jgi:hypothetical protein
MLFYCDERNSERIYIREDIWKKEVRQMDPPISTPTPELDPIDILFNRIVENTIANKSHYSKIGGSEDVHVCGNMACEQAEWIKDNYGYDVGIVILWSKCGDVGHEQTWVVIDNERYVIESTSNKYWTEPEHKDQFGELYKICFVSIQKGREHVKATAEYIRTG